MQSQDYPGATWALAQRLSGWTKAAIDDAFDAGRLIRTHVLRPTWHFVAPEDLRWLLALTGPRVQRGDASRRRALEIDDAVLTASARTIESAIARNGPRSRLELQAELARAGIHTDPARFSHLVMHAELDALICSGPRRGATHTYALVEQRVPAAPTRSREEALAELAGRYVAGHGPAQDVDLAWWAGLSLGDARRGLAAASPALSPEVLSGRTFWMSDSAPQPVPAPGPTVQLLPNFDELLVAFRDRSDALHPGLPLAARVAEEILNHVIVRDGIVVGRWQRPTAASGPVVRLEPRIAIDVDERRLLRAAVDRYAAFLGRELETVGLD